VKSVAASTCIFSPWVFGTLGVDPSLIHPGQRDRHRAKFTCSKFRVQLALKYLLSYLTLSWQRITMVAISACGSQILGQQARCVPEPGIPEPASDVQIWPLLLDMWRTFFHLHSVTARDQTATGLAQVSPCTTPHQVSASPPHAAARNRTTGHALFQAFNAFLLPRSVGPMLLVQVLFFDLSSTLSPTSTCVRVGIWELESELFGCQ
jgi:hypothetical protein